MLENFTQLTCDEQFLMETFMTIENTLEERGCRYGDFKTHAEITQAIKRAMMESPNWENITDSMREALEMIAHKIGRILNGDPKYIDSWHDIIGYARLVEQELELCETLSEQFSEQLASKIVGAFNKPPETLEIPSHTTVCIPSIKTPCHIKVGDWVEVDDDPEPWITPYAGFKAEVYATQIDFSTGKTTVSLPHPNSFNDYLTLPIEAVKLISKPAGGIPIPSQ